MICIITENELARSHGTGAAILQMFEGTDFHHFYWHVGHGMRSETPHSTLLADWVPRVRKVGGAVRLLWQWSGAGWWHGNEINPHWWRRVAAAHGARFSVAYVVVARERDAARALSLLRTLRLPYVVHLVDVLHEEGLGPSTTPAMGELLNGATGLLALLPSIAAEMGKLTRAPIRIIPVGKPVPQQVAAAPGTDGPIRLIIGGRPYAGGCRLLAESWDDVRRRCPRVELTYVGPHYLDIPSELRAVCRNAGFLRDEDDYRRFMGSAHLAYLSGPDADDMFGRWSFPSRAVDHLMAGLPLLASVPGGSATEQVLGAISPEAVAFTRSSSDITDAIHRFTASGDAWVRASHQARDFAVRTMSLDVVRDEVFRALELARQDGVPADAGSGRRPISLPT
jgi:hypothetical protein